MDREISLLEAMGVTEEPPPAIERPDDDHYRSPPECMRALASVVDLSAGMHEFCAGDGILAAAAADVLGAGAVTASTIDPPARSFFPVDRADFLAQRHLIRPHLVTNPPYSKLHGRRLPKARAATRLIRHALQLLIDAGDGAGLLCCLLDLRFALSEERNRPGGLLYDYPPAEIHAFQDRVTMYPPIAAGTTQTGGTQAFAWFIWRPPFHRPGADPVLRRVLNSRAFRQPGDVDRFDLPIIKARKRAA